MNNEQLQKFHARLKRKFPYTYNLIPSYIWTWIFDNFKSLTNE